MKLTFLLLILLASLATTTTCGGSDTAEGPLPDTRLTNALSRVPLNFSDKPLEFHDYAASLAHEGLNVERWEDYLSLDTSERDRFYEGVAIHPELRYITRNLYDVLALDIFAARLGIWSWTPGLDSQTFVLLQGNFGVANITKNLLTLEYKKDDHNGIPYYWLDEDFTQDVQHAPSRPLRSFGLFANRTVLLDDWLIGAPATDISNNLIDVQQQKDLSLLESEPHFQIAKAIGDGLIGGAFVTPSWVIDTWNTVNRSPESWLDKYLEGSDQWVPLSPYTLVLLGYRVSDGTEETVIAFYYPDPKSAKDDASKLESRWDSFYYDAQGSGEVETAVTKSCGSLVTATIELEDSSVLLGKCKVIRSTKRDLEIKGPTLWSWLYETRKLEFLVPDLRELRK